MALPSKYGIDKKINSMEGLSAYENGGKGSGNFGHSGRPGEVGGSSSGGGEFSKGDDVTFYQYGENHKGRIIRKISEKEKQDRADLNNPNAGDYYEVEIGSGDFTSKSIVWEGRIKKTEKQSKEKKLAEIRDKNRQKREAEVVKAKAEREEHIKQIDKIIGSEKIAEGKTKAEDDKNYKKLEKDIREIKKILAKEKSRENFGQEEIRKLKDKYSDYMSGNWSVTERFQRSMRDFEDWADNYVNNSLENAITDAVVKALNGGKGSGNFGHAGRPGEVGGSGKGTGASSGSGYVPKHKKDMRIREAILKSITGQKELQDRAKVVQEDIEDRIGQKVKEGEEYTALDEALKERFKYFHGEDGTEYTYDKGNGMITKTNPKTGDQEVVTKQKKDYGSEKSGVSKRDGSGIGNEFADLSAELETARTNLKMLKQDKGKAYKDLSGRLRFMDRSAEISRSLHYAETLRKGQLSKETKKLVKEMESELRSIRDEYSKLGTEKYFDPDLNVER